MPRNIDADELSNEIKHLRNFLGGESLFTPAIKETILRTIDEQPIVSAAPAPVKCGECKYQNTEDCPVTEYEFITPYDKERTLFTAFSNDGFCAKGKRKDEEKK